MVFSVEYRLAPESKFPEGLDDAWQSYNFIIDHIEQYYKVRPNKIILAGDSAGGNLCLALCFRIIEENKRLPNGVILSYPALNLSETEFSPS